MENQTVTVSTCGPTVPSSRAVLRTDCDTAMESGKKDQANQISTKGSMSTTRSAGMEYLAGLVVIYTKETISKICATDMARCIGPMAPTTKETGRKEFSMEKVS